MHENNSGLFSLTSFCLLKAYYYIQRPKVYIYKNMRYFSVINTTQLNSLQKQQVECHNENNRFWSNIPFKGSKFLRRRIFDNAKRNGRNDSSCNTQQQQQPTTNNNRYCRDTSYRHLLPEWGGPGARYQTNKESGRRNWRRIKPAAPHLGQEPEKLSPRVSRFTFHRWLALATIVRRPSYRVHHFRPTRFPHGGG